MYYRVSLDLTTASLSSMAALKLLFDLFPSHYLHVNSTSFHALHLNLSV